MNLIVSVAIILLNLYVAYGISCQIPMLFCQILKVPKCHFPIGLLTIKKDLQINNLQIPILSLSISVQ